VAIRRDGTGVAGPQEGHDARAHEVLDIIAAADHLTIWDVTEKLTWSRGWDQITGFMRRAAVAETAAHIEYLERVGRLVLRRGPAGEPDRLLVAPGDQRGAAG
jgi:hypothetical protein